MKQKLFSIIALLLMAATGAWAQGYTVTLKDGTEDADNWTITPKEGLSEGDQVTITYNGTKRVKSVTAVKKEVVKPDLLSGVFSVSASKKVNFSKGNLRYASDTWSFFNNQYGYYNSYSEDAWDKFGWSTSANTYGMNTSKSNSTYSGDFVDWGSNSDLQTALGTGWRTLTSDEWTYLFNTRSASTVGGTDNGRYAKAKVNNVKGVILFPDTYTHPDGVTAPGNVNKADASFDSYYSSSYTVADWTKMESAGCVFLPAAGYRYGSSVSGLGSEVGYWSATLNGTNNAYIVFFSWEGLDPANSFNRSSGNSVRLVKEVDAPAPASGTDLATITANYEAKDGETLTGTLGSNVKISIADGASVTLKGVTINGVNSTDYKWAGITCEGDATITLEGTNTVKGFADGYPGIFVSSGKTIVINGTGELNASSNGSYDNGSGGAGIGGGNKMDCGNIEIQSGTVTATGNYCGAGIGGGQNATCGNITISGGTVTATGGERAAGIGGGRRGIVTSICGNITISGGTITATGGEDAAGIGGGRGNGSATYSSCGTITITSGVTSVTATKGSDDAQSIGAGKFGDCGAVTIEDSSKVTQN